MTVSCRISPGEGIVYLSTDGAAPFDELERVVLSVLADPAYRPGFHFLSDRTRETDCPDSAYVRRGLEFLRARRREMGDYRWAMVSQGPPVYGMQRMFSLLGEQYGVRAEAFRDFEEARRWLVADDAPLR